jgi:hypothetical protein
MGCRGQLEIPLQGQDSGRCLLRRHPERATPTEHSLSSSTTRSSDKSDGDRADWSVEAPAFRHLRYGVRPKPTDGALRQRALRCGAIAGVDDRSGRAAVQVQPCGLLSEVKTRVDAAVHRIEGPVPH